MIEFTKNLWIALAHVESVTVQPYQSRWEVAVNMHSGATHKRFCNTEADAHTIVLPFLMHDVYAVLKETQQ